MAIDFGEDLSCVNDIASDGRTVTGNMLVGEAIARRLMTPRGRLIAYPNYGFDLTDYVNADVSEQDLAALRAGIEAECLKDERVDEVEISAVLATDGVLTITILITTGAGPFTLVLAVSSVSVTILSLVP